MINPNKKHICSTLCGNFQKWPSYKMLQRECCPKGLTLFVYEDTERNRGFEEYHGQIIDAAGNVLTTILNGDPTEIMQQLKKIERILRGVA